MSPKMMENSKVLLVEDDAKDIELTLAAWAELNLSNSVVSVQNGDEALDYLYRRGAFADRQPGNPKVVFLDLKMPKVTGLDLLRQVKNDHDLKHIPVVILTSSRATKDCAECYAHGANAYVLKPVEFDDFMAVAKQLALFWVRTNEAPQDQHTRF